MQGYMYASKTGAGLIVGCYSAIVTILTPQEWCRGFNPENLDFSVIKMSIFVRKLCEFCVAKRALIY